MGQTNRFWAAAAGTVALALLLLELERRRKRRRNTGTKDQLEMTTELSSGLAAGEAVTSSSAPATSSRALRVGYIGSPANLGDPKVKAIVCELLAGLASGGFQVSVGRPNAALSDEGALVKIEDMQKVDVKMFDAVIITPGGPGAASEAKRFSGHAALFTFTNSASQQGCPEWFSQVSSAATFDLNNLQVAEVVKMIINVVQRREGVQEAPLHLQPKTGTILLGNGVRMPSIGLGYWLCPNKEATEVTKVALSAGVRLLDGAAVYANEIGIGDGLQTAFKEGVVRREDVFVVSKLFNTKHVWDNDCSRVREGFDKTLHDLKLEYLDLYLMHWPFAFQQKDLQGVGPLRLDDGTPNPKLMMKVEFLETYAEMIKLVEAGKVRALGVCNFTQAQLELLLEKFPKHPPCVLQIEAHPYLTQPELREFCWAKGIHVMAYSPLGAGASYSGKSFPAKGTGPYQSPNAGSTLLANAVVGEIAQTLGRSPAQVLIRWSLQSGYVCIPKSARAERIRENFDVLNWSIPENHTQQLDALDCGFRYSIGYSKGHYDCPNAPWSKL